MVVAHLINVRWWNASAAYAVAAADALAARGQTSVVIADRGSPAASAARARGLEVADVPPLERPRAANVAGLAAVAALLAERAVDVLAVHRAPSHFWGACARRLARRRTVAVVAARTDVRPPRSGRLAAAFYRGATDLFVTPGEFARAPLIAALGDAAAPIHVARFPADLARIAPGDRAAARAALGLPADAPLAAVVGRLSPVKGHAGLLDAFARVRARVPDAQLLVAGDDAEVTSGALAARAGALGIGDAVHFRRRDGDPRALYAAADVGVVPSIGSEAIARVATEWMAAARPVVGTRVNAIAEAIVGGETGVLVEAGAVEPLANALASLLASPETREAMGRAARRRAETVYAPAAFGAAWEAACAAAVEARASRLARRAPSTVR